MSLANISEEDRAHLLQFRWHQGACGAVVAGDEWTGQLCDEPAKWYVTTESAHAGVTVNGAFTPAISTVRLCAAHLDVLKAEPRLVLSIEPARIQAGQGPISVIDVSSFDRFLGGGS